ncbi:unnamed protein product, partial [Closterium sp. NIES-53]
DHFLTLDPTDLTVDLLEQHLLAPETSVVAVGAARGTPRMPFFEGCSPSTLAPSYAVAAAVDVLGAEDVGAASASGKHDSSKGKGGRGGGGGSGGGGGGNSGGGGGGGGGGRVGRLGVVDEVECPHWAKLLRSGVAIFDLDYDAILSAMYALSASAEGDCYQCVPPDRDIEATALGASEYFLPSTAPAEALHTFMLDSGASRCFFRDSTTSPGQTGQPLWGLGCCPFLHCPPVSGVSVRLTVTSSPPLILYELGSSLYTLATELPQVAASAQVSASGHVAPPCSCRLLSHQTLLWHHRLGHPSLPRLRGMHSCLLFSGLPRSLPPLPPSPAPPCLPCIKGRQRAAPHSSSLHLSRSTWPTPPGARLLPVPPLSSRVRRFRAAHCQVFTSPHSLL